MFCSRIKLISSRGLYGHTDSKIISVVSGRNPYDIRAMANADIPPEPWVDYLNTAKVQDAIGVDINYTSTSSNQIYTGFDYTGDWGYPELLEDLEAVVGYGVRVALIYGDAVSACIYVFPPLYRGPPPCPSPARLSVPPPPQVARNPLTQTSIRTTSATGSAAKSSRSR